MWNLHYSPFCCWRFQQNKGPNGIKLGLVYSTSTACIVVFHFIRECFKHSTESENELENLKKKSFFSLYTCKSSSYIRLSSKGYWGPMTGLLLCISLSSSGEMSWSLLQLYNMTWKRFFRARLRDTSIRSLYPPTLVPYVILAVCVYIQRLTFRFKKDWRASSSIETK